MFTIVKQKKINKAYGMKNCKYNYRGIYVKDELHRKPRRSKSPNFIYEIFDPAVTLCVLLFPHFFQIVVTLYL